MIIKVTKKLSRLGFIILMLSFGLLSPQFASLIYGGEVVAIVNDYNEVSNITLEDLTSFYTGKKTIWENGESVVLFLPVAESEAMGFLIKDVLNKRNKADLSKFYLQAVFQQKITDPPGWIASVEEADYKVSVVPGGITLIDKKDLNKDSPNKIIELD